MGHMALKPSLFQVQNAGLKEFRLVNSRRFHSVQIAIRSYITLLVIFLYICSTVLTVELILDCK